MRWLIGLTSALCFFAASAARAATASEALCAPYEAAWAKVSGGSDRAKMQAVANAIPDGCPVKVVARRRMELAKRLSAKPQTVEQRPQDQRMQIARAPTAKPEPVQITHPDWLIKPNGDDFANYYPAIARRLGKNGRATLTCAVTSEGDLTDCTAEEDPPGFGFGDATLLISKLFKMKPLEIDGKIIGGAKIKIPVDWVIGPINNSQNR